MAQLADEMKLSGMDYVVLEDGMPKDFTELERPDFDSFVAFDIETTGTFGAGTGDAPAEITEIGAVKVVDGAVVARKDWLCNPGRPIVPRIARLTNISDAMLTGQPPVSDVIREFASWVGDLPLVGHNIRNSDLHYIRRAANRAGVAMENEFFDTYPLALRLRPETGLSSARLEDLAAAFGVDQPSAHRAWCDAEANVGVYFKLKELAGC